MTKDRSVRQSWRRIEAWLKQHAPNVHKSLRNGATPRHIQGLEGKLGVSLPKDFRESYMIHDGQTQNGCCLIPGPDDLGEWYYLLSLKGVADEWKVWVELTEGGEFDDRQGSPDEGVQETWYHPGWIPFSSDTAGAHHCIDLAPTSSGTWGQVISLSHEDAYRGLLAPSLSHWLDEFADALDGGRYDYANSGS